MHAVRPLAGCLLDLASREGATGRDTIYGATTLLLWKYLFDDQRPKHRRHEGCHRRRRELRWCGVPAVFVQFRRRQGWAEPWMLDACGRSLRRSLRKGIVLARLRLRAMRPAALTRSWSPVMRPELEQTHERRRCSMSSRPTTAAQSFSTRWPALREAGPSARPLSVRKIRLARPSLGSGRRVTYPEATSSSTDCAIDCLRTLANRANSPIWIPFGDLAGHYPGLFRPHPPHDCQPRRPGQWCSAT
jgi:hypothetical protein